MKSAIIIGSGNIANYFAYIFSKNGISIIEIHSRNVHTGQKLAKKYKTTFVKNIKQINKKANIYLLAINDDEIEKTAGQLDKTKGIVIHTSGSTDIKKLGKRKSAVLYPLQTINAKNIKRLKNVPILCEFSNSKVESKLKPFIKKISKKHYVFSSKERLKIHLAAVMLNNFTNHLHTLVFYYLRKNKLPIHIFESLIKQTYANVITGKPHQHQTGPAKRNDSATIALHLAETYKNNTDLHEIYSLFTTLLFKEYLK